jgi:hypothetical protein
VAAHPYVGVVIFALLACNTVYYVTAGRFSEALESVAWYALLILFMLETARPRLSRRAWALAAVRGARLIATLAIGASAVLYVREKEWLDASNLLLWVAVVALLEVEVWRPAAVAASRRAFTATAVVLYSALAGLVVVWLVMGKWMNAWDASLWLIAFGSLEADVLRAAKPLNNI